MQIFDSDVAKKLYETALAAALNDLNILVIGETGSGKEVVADIIQKGSARKDKPYVKINCAAIPETLIESELFGHEKGAFTGADRRKEGKLEVANGGTILLDEIGDMPFHLQSRLLRVTDGSTFTRIGSNEEISVDVRFISSTHIDLKKAIEANRFRLDLYYRLSGMVITVPPLRDRKDEIISIADRMLGAEYEFSTDALTAILAYNWPGNFRELENKISAARIKAKGRVVESGDLFETEPASSVPNSDLNLEEMERNAVLRALEMTGWVQKEAAKLLGISPRAINYKIKHFGFTHPSWGVNH